MLCTQRSPVPLLIGLALFAIPALVRGQSVVSMGAGSYASQVPPANYYTDSYYGLPAAQVEPFTSGTAIFNLLHLDPALSGTAIPTNHWWTDMLIADRSTLAAGATQYVIQQDPYGGNMWFYPGMLAPRSYGLDLYFPNSWEPANANGSPQGSINPGPALSIHGDRGYSVPPGDILVADFEESTYPAGWTATTIPGYTNAFGASPAQGSWTGQSPAPAGYLGNGLVNTFLTGSNQGSNASEGILSGTFTIQKSYINLLVGGGNDVNNTVVRLVVSGTTVDTATGQQDGTLRWNTWNVSAYQGQTATIQIVDTSPAGWGFIMCDDIVQSNSSQPAGRYGTDYTPANSVVTNWGDWNVNFKLPDGAGHEMDVSMVRGIPFTWTQWQGGLNPKIMISGTTLYDVNNNTITTGTSFITGAFSFNYQGRSYGIFLPKNTPVTVASTYLEPQLSGSNNYMVVGYLPSTADLASFAAEAYAQPTNTRLNWSLDLADGLVDTTWTITAAPLQGSNLNTIQGWLPHHYRTTTNNLVFTPYTYLTPRGTMKCAIGNSFQIDFPFKGIVPVLPAPVATGTTDDFQPARMIGYLNEFQPGTMLGDTYWSGKAMALCAQYMAWANQLEDTTDFLRLQGALETAMENWLTYTPGEVNGYFALYPNFHALIGWDASYGTQAFNDLHFHYGYFAVTGAILGMYDQQFLTNYGPMLKMLVKCYGNWDRTDNSEPFFRTFDIWEGHSNAGGTSSANGENQESSSEAMQSWAGMYLLGGDLNDSAMTAAGAMGFSMESAAVNEYWQDLYETNFPSTYNRAGNGILEANGYAYGTYFSGDPAWVYGIQYTPSNHWNNYLMRYQPATVSAKYQDMWNERAAWCASQTLWSGTGTYTPGEWVQYDNSIYAVSGTTSITGSNGTPAVDTSDWAEQADCAKSTPDVLGAGLDHVVLSYQGLWDNNDAAAEFDQYYAASESTATNPADAGATYYLIQASRCLGDQDYNYTTSIPTSAVYLNAAAGARTFTVYNPLTATAPAIVYNNGIVTGTMTIPGMTLVSSTNPNYIPTAPLAPAGLQAVAGYGSVALTWNPSQGATSYNIKRASVTGGPYTVIGTASAASFSDATAASGSTYFYVVSAVNSIGEGANSVEAEVSVTGVPVLAINCGGSSVVSFGADIDYSGGTESNTSTAVNVGAAVSPAPEAVYQTYRFGNCTYTLTGLTPGTNYNVRLHFSEDYWSAAGKRVFNVALSGTQVLSDFDIFATAGANYTAVVKQFPVTSSSTGQITAKFTTVTDNAVCCGIEIRTVAPATPGGVVATSGTGQIVLGWTASSGATTYNVKRATASGGPYSVIANPSGNSFTDSIVAPGGKYYYEVSALNGGGESGNSAAVSGTSLLAPLQQWRQSYFGTTNASDPVAGNLATPMGDGIPNLMKYALGLNPDVSDALGLPKVGFAGGLLSITFTRMAIATDMTYHVQASAELNTWTEIWNSTGVAFGGGTNLSEPVTITDTGGPQAGRRFLRLEVSQP